MIPVEQTITGAPLGNCFPACLASIFEVPLEDVPHPTIEENSSDEGFSFYMERLHAEFLYPRNLRALFFDALPGFSPEGYSVMTGQSPRGTFLHSVVALNGDIVFDPHPQRAMGMGKAHDWMVFQALDPTKPISKEK